MLVHYKNLIESEISRHSFGSQPKSLYEPIRYLMKLGGKRLRPMFVMLSYSIYKKDAEKIVSYAAAVEAFHNFTLMHDDIMDKAPLRRGKATVHEKWNVNTAILSGDVMLVRVYDMFLSLEGPKLNQVLRAFNQCAAEVCEGQQWDMEFESKAKVTEAQYIEMIRLKTAVLLGFSLELGAILADAPKADQIALREFGVNIGIGFQLKDDLLDVYADQKKFGKQVGGDIISNKKTFLLIKALEKAKGKQQKELKEWLSAKKFNAKKKVAAITGIYNSLGIAEQTELKVNWYFEKGFDQLNEVDTNGSLLIDFTQELMARQA
ncbi:MAG: polyprenyl synthetase family protein [Cytophagales bacterium]|jgi:geranylgeranyl diphosphate synthase type II|nr:polyprenyl synthetase family protein [Cytophagales bacterium]MCA6368698.1 polyprenyl synthetase family protein [Cytophagales bacterium]MCA6370811.1 polyprenyl synthetase family protein [Cytophagales bacterium]MCA6376946.1 polyprenyl synthetase family protein [Cytophagales bacterium]MCA6383109.1 polyprenyl synthetase family protein [Cytophagales bacterium]